MRYAYAFAGLAALAAASDVHDLKADTFKDFIGSHDLVLAEFFAPWCGHCKALAPEYEEAATTLKTNGQDIQLAKVDCTEQADLCQEYGVEGYPTLKVFRGLDNIDPYAGPRKAGAIVSYMTKQSLPAVSELKDVAALTEFKATDKVVVVGYFAANDNASNKTLDEVANKLRSSYPFAAITDPDLAKAAGVKQPALVVYKTFDEGQDNLEKKFVASDIETFIKTAATPLIGEVGPETYSAYMDAKIPLAYIFSEEAEEREEFAKEFKSIAEKYKGKINFATIDAKAFGAHAGNLNLKPNEWPAFAIQDTEKNQKYPFEKQGNKKDLSSKAIGKFVADYAAGKVEPSVKSEEVPEKQEGPVTVVVAKSWTDVVLDDKKDVLVEFYAPWCGHCKALAPKYDELALMFKDHADKIVVAKVDATANDVPEEIAGFPTIKLYPAGKKSSPVDYSGSRTPEDLAKFITENGTHKVEGGVAGAEETPAVETDKMPHQAAAATEKVKEAAKKIVEAAAGDDDGIDDHDEL